MVSTKQRPKSKSKSSPFPPHTLYIIVPSHLLSLRSTSTVFCFFCTSTVSRLEITTHSLCGRRKLSLVRGIDNNQGSHLGRVADTLFLPPTFPVNPPLQSVGKKKPCLIFLCSRQRISASLKHLPYSLHPVCYNDILPPLQVPLLQLRLQERTRLCCSNVVRPEKVGRRTTLDPIVS